MPQLPPPLVITVASSPLVGRLTLKLRHSVVAEFESVSPEQAACENDVTVAKQFIDGVHVHRFAGQSAPTALSAALITASDANIAGQKLAWLTVMPSLKLLPTAGTHCEPPAQSESAQSTKPSQSLSMPSKQAVPVSAAGTQVRSGGR